MGLGAFAEEQLHPERLGDSAVNERLAPLTTLSMSAGELMEKYPRPNPLEMANAREAMERAQESGKTPLEAMAAMRADGAVFGAMGEATATGPLKVLSELAEEEMLRAVYSRRQLQEVMVQFWMNHFNIFGPKGADLWLLTSFERDVIRPRALGTFEDLLVATAKSPAMLVYLDNWMSVAPNTTVRPPGFGPAPLDGFSPRPMGAFQSFRPASFQAAPNLQRRGLNENYGRELMELHTLGVNGGYTQQDVIEVARCLTGWTVGRPRQQPEFFFNAAMHDTGEKVVLGHRIQGGRGIEDGLDVLHILAAHPSTAQHISLKLCRRFVADDPPASLVDRARGAFLASSGDLRAVVKTIVTSPEFYSQAAWRAKVKSPLEMVASTLRALDADTDAGRPLLAFVRRMGEPFFLYQAPTGYPDRANAWINSSSLLERLNFALAIASDGIPGTKINFDNVISKGGQASSAEALDALSYRLTGGALSAGTRRAILQSLDGAATPAGGDGNPFAQLSTVAALVIGSPEFQRR